MNLTNITRVPFLGIHQLRAKPGNTQFSWVAGKLLAAGMNRHAHTHTHTHTYKHIWTHEQWGSVGHLDMVIAQRASGPDHSSQVESEVLPKAQVLPGVHHMAKACIYVYKMAQHFPPRVKKLNWSELLGSGG